MKTYFIFICIMVTIGVCIYCGAKFFSPTETIDLFDIINYPQNYTEQTFTNNVIMMDRNCFANPRDGQLFTLEMPFSLKQRIETLFTIYKKGQKVKITYRIYDWKTFTQIEDYQESQDIQEIEPIIIFNIDSEKILIKDLNSIGILLDIEIRRYQ